MAFCMPTDPLGCTGRQAAAAAKENVARSAAWGRFRAVTGADTVIARIAAKPMAGAAFYEARWTSPQTFDVYCPGELAGESQRNKA